MTPYCAPYMRQNFWWTCSCQIRTAHPVRICLLWWTCGELNSGLTRFKRGHYTLSLWSVSPTGSPQTNCAFGIPPKFIGERGKSAVRQRSLLDNALPSVVGSRRRTGRKSYAASATRRAVALRAVARLPVFSSAIKKFPFLRSRASDVRPTRSACNRIRNRPIRSCNHFIPCKRFCQMFFCGSIDLTFDIC